MESDVEMPKQLAGYTQFMLYTDVNLRTAKPILEPIWADMKSLFDKHYQYGSAISIAYPADSPPIDYYIAMVPFIDHVEHPDFPDKVVRQLVYLIQADLWPYVAKPEPNEISHWMFPARG